MANQVKSNKAKYFAHSKNVAGFEEPLSEHLSRVAERAKRYASAFNSGFAGYLSGLLHDIGKYGDLFQKRLRGEEKGVDHWFSGACIAIKRYKAEGVLPALAIYGHHIGLQSAFLDFHPEIKSNAPGPSLKLSETNVAIIEQRFLEDGLEFPDPPSSIETVSFKRHAQAMLDVRMLFSALVDADYIETEAHFHAPKEGVRCLRPEPVDLEPGKNLEILIDYIEALERKSDASEELKTVRRELLRACLAAAEDHVGLFTCTAPTGSGKTLSLLAFALKHAEIHGLRRIIVVLPYLTIIEQTASEYKKALADSELVRHVLEDHSLVGALRAKSDEYSDMSSLEERLVENWDAPVIITTSVRFLESLFSNRPSACRKLHNVANSVVLFDEVQTIPLDIVLPTLATLSRLSERYSVSIVFATATQPAFSKLDEQVRKYTCSGWSPREIVIEKSNLYSKSRRVEVFWPDKDTNGLSLEELLDTLAKDASERLMCVLNLKRHALAVFDGLKDLGLDGVYHLSTSMCPAHRSRVLEEIRNKLENGEPCRLVSTQCVEAGVDIDFPVVYRAWGPLDSIAQAAGRCNRSGKLTSGRVHVFKLKDESGKRLYPDRAYERAADVTSLVLKSIPPDSCSIDTPDIFSFYFEELYKFTDFDTLKKELQDSIKRLDFVDVASMYKVIQEDTINVLVPYEEYFYSCLVKEALEHGLSRNWVIKARPHAVSIFKPRSGDPVQAYLQPVPVRERANSKQYKDSKDWFIYLNREHYHPETGLRMPEDSNCWIG